MNSILNLFRGLGSSVFLMVVLAYAALLIIYISAFAFILSNG